MDVVFRLLNTRCISHVPRTPSSLRWECFRQPPILFFLKKKDCTFLGYHCFNNFPTLFFCSFWWLLLCSGSGEGIAVSVMQESGLMHGCRGDPNPHPLLQAQLAQLMERRPRARDRGMRQRQAATALRQRSPVQRPRRRRRTRRRPQRERRGRGRQPRPMRQRARKRGRRRRPSRAVRRTRTRRLPRRM